MIALVLRYGFRHENRESATIVYFFQFAIPFGHASSGKKSSSRFGLLPILGGFEIWYEYLGVLRLL